MILLYFLTVNYGTSEFIEKWASSIRSLSNKSTLVLVDNYKSQEERKKTIDITHNLDIHLIKSENVGYGRGLNKAIDFCLEVEGDVPFIIFAGNLDIEFEEISFDYNNDKSVYVPIVEEESNKNRNPMLTYAQKLIIPVYHYSCSKKSILLLYFAILLNKLTSLIPSRLWAVHGSLFCFNSNCVEKKKPIFNENSFLYCEEMEFASYMENNNAKFKQTAIHIKHQQKAATGKLVTSKNKFFELWLTSFNNWYRRWK